MVLSSELIKDIGQRGGMAKLTSQALGLRDKPILLVAAAKYGLKKTDEEGYAFVQRHLLRSNENTLLFFLLLKYFMMLKSRTLITLLYFYIIFDLNISTSPLLLTKYAPIIGKKTYSFTSQVE